MCRKAGHPLTVKMSGVSAKMYGKIQPNLPNINERLKKSPTQQLRYAPRFS
jgi:hypothetical protein